jgi:hypothetical protein
MRFHVLVWPLMRVLDEISCFLAADLSFLMVSCKDGGEIDVEGYERLSVHNGSLWFVCASWVVRWRGMNVSWVMVVGESAIALEDRRVCVEVV